MFIQENVLLRLTFNPGLVLIDFRTTRPRIVFNHLILVFRVVILVMSLPINWDPMPLNEDGKEVTVYAVRLSRESSEYQEVAKKFHQTAGLANIVTIERIQNPHLYHSYQLKKEKMNNDNEMNSERQLFHGTKPDNLAKINNQGFNRSFSLLKGKDLNVSLI